MAFATAAEILLVLIILLQQRKYLPAWPWIVLLALGALSFVLMPFLPESPLYRFLPGLLITLIPFAYWIFVRTLLAEGFRLNRWHYVWVLLQIVVFLISFAPGRPFLLPGLTALDKEFLRRLPVALLAVVWIGLALQAALRGFQDDLLTESRRLRLRLVLLGALSLFFFVFLKLTFLSPSLLALADTIAAGAAFLLTNLAALLLLRPAPFLLAERSRAAAPEDPLLRTALERLLEQEKIYRKEGLTIQALARTLECREYRLRQLINGALGFRNFNDFLNRYRIQEACERLQTEETPVVRIAMDLGYRSLSSFNQAFKAHCSLTPTEYRKKQK
ncbi:MAG: helix-turn-helix transcriptional regulator [Spirochaetales bacterium]|nr:helix-turn-helix transcriptional regulator [Spirochaetales bacterium]